MTLRTLLIEEFCRTGSGTTPPRSKADAYFGGDIPWVKSGELREGIISSTEESVTETALKETSLKLVPAGAILIAMYGANVGRLGILGIEATTNQAVCHLVPNPNVADTRYLFHALLHDQPALIRKGVGGAQPNISQEIIRKTEIRLPPLAEQRRIAAILDQADDLRRKRREALEQIEKLPLSLFDRLFGDPMINAKKLRSSPLGNISALGSGGTPSKDNDRYWNGSYPWVSPKDMKGLRIFDTEDHISEDAFLETNLKRIPPGTPLVVVRGMILAHTVPIAMVMTEVAINQDMKSIHFNEEIVPEFGLWCLKAESQAMLSKVSTAAHGTKRLDSEVLRQFPILVPPVDEQRAFAVRIVEIDKLKAAHRAHLEKLDALFDALQHRAFRGELTDYPARKLLAELA